MFIGRRSFIASSLVASAAVATGALHTPSANAATGEGAHDKIDDLMLQSMKDKGIVGGCVAVVRNGKVLKSRGYGLASVEHNVPADENTVFIMASSSKMFSALVAMKLVEAGKLDLDESIRHYLPETPSHYTGVKVYQLLAHTSGLAGPGDNPAFVTERAVREKKDKATFDEVVDTFTASEEISYASKLALKHEPGAEWHYAQYPVMLFGQIVLAVTGKRYDKFVMENIFGPLKMSATAYGDVRSVIPKRNPVNYSREHGVLENVMPLYTRNYWTAAGCNTSAVDAAKMLLALAPGKVLSQKSLDRIWTNTVMPDGKVRNYGLAFTIYKRKLIDKWVGHEGGGCSYFGFSPEHQLGVAVIFNTSATRLDDIDYRVAELVLS